jgi:hypothetical protein
LDAVIVAETGEPMHVRLAAEPCNLSLGVPARSLLDFSNSGGERCGVENVVSDLSVPKESERLGRGRNLTSHNVVDFIQPARSEHSFDAMVNLCVEFLPVGEQANFCHCKALQGGAIAAAKLAGGFSGEETEFDGSYELLRVAAGDLAGSDGIAPEENAMKVLRTAEGGSLPKALAKSLRAAGKIVKTFEKSAKIETGTDSEDGKLAAKRDFFENLQGVAAVVSGSENMFGFGEIYEVMGNSVLLRWRDFAGAYIEVAVNLSGVAADDFAMELLRERKSEGGFAGRGGSQDDHEAAFGIHGWKARKRTSK